MTNIEQALHAIEAHQLIEVKNRTQQWQGFCEHYESIFTLARERKAEMSDKSVLLGVLTKAHIEALAQIERNEHSTNVMREAIATHLGEEHQHRFTDHSAEQLIFVTHLWLYLQGYMDMDFSLANDYAEQTVQALSKSAPISQTHTDVQALRSAFMASFYEGKKHAPPANIWHSLSQKMKRWLA